MSNPNIPFSASIRNAAPPTASSPINQSSYRNSRGSYTNPTTAVTTTQPNNSAKPEKEKEKKKRKRNPWNEHRHSYGFKRLISAEDSSEDEDEGKFSSKTIIQKLPKLTEEEEKFFELVKSGNVSGVGEMHEKLQNCVLIKALNFEGYTVLHIAAARQDEEMVGLLCNKFGHCVEAPVLNDVLLHAIKEGNVDIVKQLLEVMKKRGIPVKGVTANPTAAVVVEEPFPNSNFTDDLTPFCLAAQGQSYELMGLFYDMGHRISQHHEDNCICADCDKFSDISKAIRRLNICRALYNPAYSCFIAFKDTDAGRDIVTEAFKNIEHIEMCLKAIKHFTAQYKELLDKLKEFTCDLLGQCRNADEVHTFLQPNTGYTGTDEDYPRLSKALELHHKNFVAHPHCQMVLYGLWVDGWPQWPSYSPFTKLAICIAKLGLAWLLTPLFGILLVFYQKGKSLEYLLSPVNRFLDAVISDLYFLSFVFLANIHETAEGDRGPPALWLRIVITVFVCGHCVNIYRQFHTKSGSKELFFVPLWTWFDVVTQLMFVGAISCWWRAVATESQKANLPRKWWPDTEPDLLAEAFFSVASIMAYSRLIRLLQFNYRIGPLITAMGEMVMDIINVLVFITIIVISFAAGLYYLYRSYDGWTDKDKDGKDITQGDSLTTIWSSLNTLFYALFGMSGADAANIIETHLPDSETKDTTTVHHHFTQTTGKLIYAAFHLIANMMAMSLVGGLVISHYDRIRGNVDTEWKFVRGQLWMSFVRGTVSPSPLNLLPTTSCLFKTSCGRKSKPERDAEAQGLKGIKKIDYTKLVQQLIQRYVRDKAEVEEAKRADSEIVTSLQEELSELREAMEKSERFLKERVYTGNYDIPDTAQQQTPAQVPLEPIPGIRSVNALPPSNGTIRRPVISGPSAQPTRSPIQSRTTLDRTPSDTSTQAGRSTDRSQLPAASSRPPPLVTPSRSQLPGTSSRSTLPATAAPSTSSGRSPLPKNTTPGRPPAPPLPPLPSASESASSVAATFAGPSSAQAQPSTDASASLPAGRRRPSDLSKGVRPPPGAKK